ncbi:hypothetical protein DIPPA_16858 [Diplonema papillatum]|nr:hypothetical protein DIPPA_16858 [Diplonema papillatum]KAJ9458686.1 hypothetical protein DIPPA_16858 [Diplonema papillatum]
METTCSQCGKTVAEKKPVLPVPLGGGKVPAVTVGRPVTAMGAIVTTSASAPLSAGMGKSIRTSTPSPALVTTLPAAPLKRDASASLLDSTHGPPSSRGSRPGLSLAACVGSLGSPGASFNSATPARAAAVPGLPDWEQTMKARMIQRLATGKQEFTGSVACKKCRNVVVENLKAQTDALRRQRPDVEAMLERVQSSKRFDQLFDDSFFRAVDGGDSGGEPRDSKHGGSSFFSDDAPAATPAPGQDPPSAAARSDESDDSCEGALSKEKEAVLAEIEAVERELATLRVGEVQLSSECQELYDSLDLLEREAHSHARISSFLKSEEAASTAAWEAYCKSELSRLRGTKSTLHAFFNLDTSKEPSSVNGFRLAMPTSRGDTPSSVVWQEVNTALGYLALLLHTLKTLCLPYAAPVAARKLNKYSFVLQGSHSKIVVLEDSGKVVAHNLYSAEGCSTTSVDEGIVSLCRAVRRVSDAAGVALPHDVKTTHLALAEGDNDEWPMQMRSLVQNFGAILAHFQKYLRPAESKETQPPLPNSRSSTSLASKR